MARYFKKTKLNSAFTAAGGLVTKAALAGIMALAFGCAAHGPVKSDPHVDRIVEHNKKLEQVCEKKPSAIAEATAWTAAETIIVPGPVGAVAGLWHAVGDGITGAKDEGILVGLARFGVSVVPSIVGGTFGGGHGQAAANAVVGKAAEGVSGSRKYSPSSSYTDLHRQLTEGECRPLTEQEKQTKRETGPRIPVSLRQGASPAP